MALEQRLEAKLLQKLILTPQLQQAIKFLQMPQLELSQTLNNELIENPFLEETVEESSGDDEKFEDMDERPGMSEMDDSEVPLERLVGFGVDDYFDNRSYDGRDLGYFSPDNNPIQSLEQYVSQGTDLYDHLMWQLRLSDVPEDIKAVAEVVIGNIDENGYLESDDEEMARFAGADAEKVREAVRFVQGFDPAGIAARSLQECLLLQVKQLGLESSLVENIVKTGLKDLEKRKYQKLAADLNVGMEEIKQAVKIIEGLEPKPGRSMSGGQPVYIKPDVYVVKDGEDFRIILNDENIPGLRINSYYRKLLMNKNSFQKEEREYLNERLRSAVWLLKSLDHRNKTIYRVTECILNFQREFFEKGVSLIKPLNLKDVAGELGMHESTISRATSNKYLSCSHGLFNFRFFFSSGIKGDFGTVSSTSIKDLIKKIISEEDAAKPLSDQKLVEMLKNVNINVARRTVAKYRDELNINPQNMRKRQE